MDPVDASPVKPSISETTIYSDSDVTVTTSRIQCGGMTYELRNITAVKMGEAHPNAIPTLLAIAIGMCLLVTALARLEFNPAAVSLFIAGIALVAFAARHVHQLTPDYCLLISSLSGEIKAFTSKDRKQVEQIVAGVNEALVWNDGL